MRLQKLVVMTALASALSSVNVSALGLGEVKLYSSLNQPLVAEIELLQVTDLTKNEILPNLASRSDFERAGVDRPVSLTGLTFKTVLDDDGKRVIRVTSTKPVQEPFLNFLLEVHWPSGRLLREYTLLLDPPAFKDQPTSSVQPPEPPSYSTYDIENEVPAGQGGIPAPGVQVPDTSVSRVSKLNLKSSSDQGSGSSSRSAESSDQYRVQSNDTLWEIALQVRPGGDLTVQQTMLAIQRNNPQAFIGGNINRLKRGEVLRIPDRREIENLSVREAVAGVARQNSEWRGEGRVAQIDGTRRSVTQPASSTTAKDGKLAIVGASTQAEQGQDLGGDQSASNGALQTELAMTRERLDQLTRENAELTSRLTDLDDQIATLKRLLTLKDDQMAALESEIRESPKQTEPTPKVAPVEMSDPEPQSGFIDFLLGNPLILALLGMLPLGLGGFLLYRRRKEQDELVVDEEASISSLDLNSVEPDESKGRENADDLRFDESLEIDESLLTDEMEPEETTQETEDALSEADIYIAYGRFNQAADLLSQAISEEPQRTDLRLKLLEVHAENNDLESFKEAYEALESLGDVEAVGKAETFKARFPSGSFDNELEAADDLNELDLGFDLDEESETSADQALDDLEFDDEDLEVPQAAKVTDEEAFDFDLDGLDLDVDSTVHSDETLPDLDLDDFDLNLDDDKNSSEAPVTQDAEAAFSEEGGSSLEAAINDDDLDFLSDDDEVATKLDLARAYMDMGDTDGAKDILQEALEQGSDDQKAEAQKLIDQIQ